jgi:hypothetical protein
MLSKLKLKFDFDAKTFCKTLEAKFQGKSLDENSRRWNSFQGNLANYSKKYNSLLVKSKPEQTEQRALSTNKTIITNPSYFFNH